MVILRVLYGIGPDFYYMFKMEGKDNALPGYTTSIVVIIVMISFVFDIFFAEEYDWSLVLENSLS